MSIRGPVSKGDAFRLGRWLLDHTSTTPPQDEELASSRWRARLARPIRVAITASRSRLDFNPRCSRLVRQVTQAFLVGGVGGSSLVMVMVTLPAGRPCSTSWTACAASARG